MLARLAEIPGVTCTKPEGAFTSTQHQRLFGKGGVKTATELATRCFTSPRCHVARRSLRNSRAHPHLLPGDQQNIDEGGNPPHEGFLTGLDLARFTGNPWLGKRARFSRAITRSLSFSANGTASHKYLIPSVKRIVCRVGCVFYSKPMDFRPVDTWPVAAVRALAPLSPRPPKQVLASTATLHDPADRRASQAARSP